MFQRIEIELQEKILTAQEQQTALIERISNLEKEMARFEAWEAEKLRYELTDFGGGTFAYLLKEEMSSGEPSHRICAACYEKHQKSILQSKGRNAFQQEHWVCPECKTDFHFGERQRAQTQRRVSSKGNWMGR